MRKFLCVECPTSIEWCLSHIIVTNHCKRGMGQIYNASEKGYGCLTATMKMIVLSKTHVYMYIYIHIHTNHEYVFIYIHIIVYT